MKFAKKQLNKKLRGAALIMSLIFIAIFSALAVAMATMSTTNLHIANNCRKANRAFASAESGLDTIKFWLDRVYLPGTTAAIDRYEAMANFMETDMGAVGITLNKTYDGEGGVISVDVNNITVNTALEQSFSAVVRPTENVDILEMDVTGRAGSVQKTIRVHYNYGTRAHTVFDFGVATKGPLHIAGNIELTGVNVEVDSSVYIESENDDNVLSIIGNSQIAGDVKITNENAIVELQGGQAGIGGETGQAAIDNHVQVGVPPTEFPVPMPEYFEQYVESTYSPNDVTTVFDNVRIPAGMNPVFTGGETFRGVLYIESPNIVTFAGNVTITGIIVGNGDLNDNSATNQIIFLGTVDSRPVTELPEDDPSFTELREETGTFLMAPGFAASFGGDFGTLNGAIASNGVDFFGNAGGTIAGSVINYSDRPMTLSGNSDLLFNRSGVDEVPAGFGPEIIMYYVPDSYREVH